MSTKSILALVFAIMAMVIAAAWYIDGLNQDNNYVPEPDDMPVDWEEPAKPAEPEVLSEEQALMIAERECIKGGEALGPGTYNEMTKTWWFDANLNATKPGCNPACVVSEETRTVEINWRCTGAIPPSPGAKITNFEECVAAGNPVMETYPRQCNASGQNFVEQIKKTMTCSAESRKADVCAQVYDPVCATVEIQCVKAPCVPVKQTFSSSCEACKNPLVKIYAPGACGNQ